MKKVSCLISSLLSLLLMGSATIAQNNYNKFLRAVESQSEFIDTRIDNMGYWRGLAEKGLVQVAPSIPIPKAKYTGSEIRAKSVKGGKEDSIDIPITEQTNTSQSENSVFINPIDNEFVLNSNNSVGAPTPDMYGADFFISEDAGSSWEGSIEGVGGINMGDPAAAINLNGSRMFINYIDFDFGQGIAWSENAGNSWSTATVATVSGQAVADKNHMWIDNSPQSSFEGNLYVAWTDMGGPLNGEIAFTRSTDNGESWETAVEISSESNAGSFNQGVNLQTGLNGEIYAAWSIYDGWPQDERAIGFAKSTDGGQSFEPAIRIIDNIQGIRVTGVNKDHRVNSFPVMACDISSGPYSGNIYVVWTNIGVPGINNGEDADIYLIKSEDEGSSWSDPIRINQDFPNQGYKHYFPWITCDPETGFLHVVFYDDRNVGGADCEVFCANSMDGGENWDDFKVSDVSFTPSPIPGLADGYMGDYLGITARGGIVYPAWTDNRNGQFMTYTSPYYANTLPYPVYLEINLDENNGETALSWQIEEKSSFQYFNIYRNGELLGTTPGNNYSCQLPDYGLYTYKVTAQHDDGESVAATGHIQWGSAIISTMPGTINVELENGGSTTETIIVENIGELELEYSIMINGTDNKDSKAYCEAGGGCLGYIQRIVFGEINNYSGCDGYADYTNLSTTVVPGATYNIMVDNGLPFYVDDLAVWVDWNQDEEFAIVDEREVCDPDNMGQGTYSFIVPENALNGQTTMRVRIKSAGSSCGIPCGSTTWGEVEDYSVNVLGWMSIDNYGGTIASGESEEINITLDAMDIPQGTYTAELKISSNDPENELIIVPVTLIVGNSTGIYDFVNEKEIVIAPNPGNGLFTLKSLSKKIWEMDLSIFNSLGSLIYSKPGIRLNILSPYSIDLTGYVEGLYFVKLNSRNSNIVKKIVIQK